MGRTVRHRLHQKKHISRRFVLRRYLSRFVANSIPVQSSRPPPATKDVRATEPPTGSVDPTSRSSPAQSSTVAHACGQCWRKQLKMQKYRQDPRYVSSQHLGPCWTLAVSSACVTSGRMCIYLYHGRSCRFAAQALAQVNASIGSTFFMHEPSTVSKPILHNSISIIQSTVSM
jgi:hypothetical protein